MFGKFGMLGAVAVAAVAADAATITKQTVQQMWPWNDKVRIDYTLDCAAGEQYDVELKVTDPLGRDVTGVLNDQTGESEYVTAGDHTIVWTPQKENFADGNMSPLLKFELQLREPAGKKYMVIDLDTGDPANESFGPFTVSYLDEAPSGGFNTDEYKTKKIVFRRCRAGSYIMGSPETEAGRYTTGCLETQHKVTFTHDFYLGIFEFTVGQSYRVWKCSVAATANSKKTLTSVNPGCTYRYKASETSKWSAAGDDVDKDSLIGKFRAETPSGLPAGYAIDLPTEAQWEYACRAGTTTAWNNGQDPDYYPVLGQGSYGYPEGVPVEGYKSDHVLDTLGQYCGNGGLWRQNVPAGTVGRYLPNAWGFYDMHGNAAEIVREAMVNTMYDYGSAPAVDPRGVGANSTAQSRGGHWLTSATACRSASRQNVNAYLGNAQSGHGVRIAVVYAPDAKVTE